MSARTGSRLTPNLTATNAFAPGHAPLRRKCACGGGTADLTRECEACRGEKTTSRYAQLVIGEPDDVAEREADRLATSVVNETPAEGARSHAAHGLPISRRADGAGPSGLAAPDSVRVTLRTAGEPLPPAMQAYFAPRFGHDFSRVRIHRDPQAAQSARDIAAHAYTTGHHVVFAPGRYDPHSVTGRRLLAHELTHVVQQGDASADVLRRSPDEAVESQAFDCVEAEITTDPEHEGTLCKSPGDSGIVDLGTAYPGDVLLVRLKDANDSVLSADDVSWTLPPELEIIGAAARGGWRMRVVPGAVGDRVLSFGFVAGSGEEQRLTLTLATLPARPEAIDPAFSRLREARGKLRDERRAARRAAKAERKGQGQQLREERRARRAERREERRAFRERGRDLRRERRELRRPPACGEATQKEVQGALLTAIAATSGAITRLGTSGALLDPVVGDALTRCMRWTPTDKGAPTTARHLARIVDTLFVARNSMTIATSGDFDCTQTGCDETTGAWVKVGHRATGSSDAAVRLCPRWTSGNVEFPLANGRDEARAYALLHEFVHQSGPLKDEENRFFVGRSDWGTLGAAEALSYADSYAALAWTLGRGKK